MGTKNYRIKLFAPIILFVYNRPEHTQKAINALLNNRNAKNSLLYVYADGPKENSTANETNVIEKTRQIVQNINGFRNVEVKASAQNKGLANSIIEGVTEVINKHGKAIILEDDIIVSPYFLDYMNDALEVYQDNDKVISIHAYNYPVEAAQLQPTFFIRGADCWGWATWKRGWDLFEKDAIKLLETITSLGLESEFDRGNTYPFARMLKDQIDGKVDSWAIRWYASAFIKDKYTLYPAASLIKNIGFDNSGTHSGGIDNFNSDLWNDSKPVEIIKIDKIESDATALTLWKKYFKELHALPATKLSVMHRLFNRLKSATGMENK